MKVSDLKCVTGISMELLQAMQYKPEQSLHNRVAGKAVKGMCRKNVSASLLWCKQQAIHPNDFTGVQSCLYEDLAYALHIV